MTSESEPRRRVPLDQISADDVRRVLRRIVRKEPVYVAKFGSAI